MAERLELPNRPEDDLASGETKLFARSRGLLDRWVVGWFGRLVSG